MAEELLPAATMIATRLGLLCVRELGSGPPAVLWHSLFVDSTTWVRVRDELAEQRRLLMIDGPCHGDSTPTSSTFSLEDCAGAAGDILDHLGVDVPVDWVGNAWGGHVGIMFAAATPTRVRSLVTIGTPVPELTPAQRRPIMALLPLYRLLGPVRPLVGSIVDALVGHGSDLSAGRLVADAFRRAHRRGMSIAIRSVSLNRPNLTPTLRAVTAPTLLIAGADDTAWSPTEARAASASMSQGASASLPGAGHVAPLLVAAPELGRLLTDFWADPAGVATSRAQP